MIVSWNWLKDYVELDMTHDELVDRLTMSGLNHEGTEPVAGDQAIDLEVTSNRPDCLGHIGVAREIAVLYERELKLPEIPLKVGQDSIENHCQISIESPETCYRYTARLIRGVKIGPSPQWLQDRLTALGIGVVNNVVDVTNYVMMECGQPLHAFDFAKIKGGQIIVRSAKDEEKFVAIDHKTYQLAPGMCVIADAEDAVCLGGVMGGADSEVSESTTDILLEAAYFDQLAVRSAARQLKLHSPSSFRFERNIDSAMIDWASRRAAQLIQELAGGEVLDGFIDVGQAPETPAPVTLRLPQLQRLLGIEIPAEFAKDCLERLGLEIKQADDQAVTAVPPSWRKDLTREADLVEEVGRVYGFDKVPDNANVPMAASYRPQSDRLLDKVRQVLTAAGFDEAMTPSLVPEVWSEAFSPWTDAAPMMTSQPMLGVLESYSQNIGAVNLLRRSLVPSLLEARRINEYRDNHDAALFETAHVYLTRGEQELPDQPKKLGLVSPGDFFTVKGILETLVDEVCSGTRLDAQECHFELLDLSRSCELKLDGQTLGWLGEVSQSAAKKFGLRSAATVAELDLAKLEELLVSIPQYETVSLFPEINRDFNFIVDDAVRWSELASVARSAGGPLLESVTYRETFRDPKKDGEGKKRILMTVVLRSAESTLTGEEADAACGKIIAACQSSCNAILVS